jgi:hypothetical protein
MIRFKHQKYRQVWIEIKNNLTADITISRDLAPTVVQGIKRIKCEENVSRKSLGLIPFSRMFITEEVISESKGLIKITFTLHYDNRL